VADLSSCGLQFFFQVMNYSYFHSRVLLITTNLWVRSFISVLYYAGDLIFFHEGKHTYWINLFDFLNNWFLCMLEYESVAVSGKAKGLLSML